MGEDLIFDVSVWDVVVHRHFDEVDNQVKNDEEHLNDNQRFFKLNYLDKEYLPKIEEN